MEETKLRQLFKNRADAYLNTIDESVEQGMSEDCFIKAVNEAINYTHSCKSDSEQLPKRKRECTCSGMSDKVKCDFKCYD